MRTRKRLSGVEEGAVGDAAVSPEATPDAFAMFPAAFDGVVTGWPDASVDGCEDVPSVSVNCVRVCV